MKENMTISILEKTNACFAYTDRNHSYLQVHCKDNKLTDGLWTKNLQLMKNFFIYDTQKKKKIFPSDFEKINYKPHEVELCYKSAVLKISLLYSDKNIQKLSDYPILRFNFSDKDNRFSFGGIFSSTVNPVFYDESGKQISSDVFDVKTKKAEKILILKNQSEKSYEDKDIFCCFGEIAAETKFSELFKNYLNQLDDFFARFSFDCSTDFGKSLYWAIFSGWLLVTGNTHRGIWAGLPWFRDNWGRDTFIALPGILLVSGQFEEAKSVISSFAQFQDKNPESKTYGRIPNRYIDEDNVIYNTADGTLWFVREVWEYLQYTKDIDFLNSMWEVIKFALEIDIKTRTDQYGFLLHGDADTWMDARIRGQNPLSPRGSRANDIQILWYTGLKIAEKMAKMQNDVEAEKLFGEKSEIVKNNFIKFFYDEKNALIGDRLGDKDILDLSVRPNLFFCFSVCQRLGFPADIFTETQKYPVAKNAFGKLAFDYGIMSLSQDHEEYHPFHDKCKKHHKDAAYHNGTIWVWNSGPVIDSLCDLHQQNAAYKLSSFHAKQMLDFEDDKTFGSRCLGSLSENINAHKVKNRIYPSGTWSQAWSVSEFARNVYQSYLGIVPSLLENKIDFYPNFPVQWKEGSVKFAFGNNFGTLKWKKNSSLVEKKIGKCKVNFYDFELSLENPEKIDFSVKAVFDDALETKIFTFDESNKITFTCGILFDSEDFDFAKPIDISKNKPKSIKKRNYLFNKILSNENEGFYTPVK